MNCRICNNPIFSELAEDMKKMHGIDVEKEMANINVGINICQKCQMDILQVFDVERPFKVKPTINVGTGGEICLSCGEFKKNMFGNDSFCKDCFVKYVDPRLDYFKRRAAVGKL